MPSSPRTPMLAIALAIAAAGLIAAIGALSLRLAGDGEAVQETASPVFVEDQPLAGGLSSLEAIGEAVIAGLAADDRPALAALLIDPADYSRLFAELSNHPSAAQLGPALVWDMQSRETADELDRTLTTYRDRHFRLTAIVPERSDPRSTITIHRRPRLEVIDEVSGDRLRLQILGSVIEHRPSQTFVLLSYRFRGDSPSGPRGAEEHPTDERDDPHRR